VVDLGKSLKSRETAAPFLKALTDKVAGVQASGPVRSVNWEGCRAELQEHLGRSPVAADMPDILCGPVLEDLSMDHQGKATALKEAEESFRLFYKMVEDILTLKEIEERARQAANNVANG